MKKNIYCVIHYNFRHIFVPCSLTTLNHRRMFTVVAFRWHVCPGGKCPVTLSAKRDHTRRKDFTSVCPRVSLCKRERDFVIAELCFNSRLLTMKWDVEL